MKKKLRRCSLLPTTTTTTTTTTNLRRCSSVLPTTTTTTTTFNSSSSSSNKLGSFIILASANKYARYTTDYSEEHSLIMLSDESVSESYGESSGDWPWRYDDGKVVFHIGGSKDQSFKVDVDNEEEEDQPPLVLVLKSLGVPSLSSYCFNKIIGSCKGLVCLFDNKTSNLLCLWNPATKTRRILPKPEEFGGRPDQLFAFGFDVETKDYKVLQITSWIDEGMFFRPISPIECICRVQVYSLSTNSWRLLEGITCLPGDPFGCSDDEEVLYLNGSCFFLANFFHTRHQPCFPESDRFIISFDFTKEIITPMQLPDHHQDQKLYLSSLGDKMALFTKSYHNNGTCKDYNVWVLKKKEHNGSSSNSSVNKESWTNLHSFQIEPIRPGQSYKPIGLSNDGEFALLEIWGSSAFSKKIKLYHFATEELKSFLSCNRVMSKAIAYEPSLVSVIGGNCAAAAATADDRVI